MMVDLVDDAKMFEISAKFRGVCSALRVLVSGGEPDGFQKNDLKWAGEMFCTMDWKCSDYESSSGRTDSGMVVLATKVRPKFYSALESVKFPHPYSPDIDFRDRFYRTLELGGDLVLVSDAELEWGVRFVDRLSVALYPLGGYSSSVE